MSEGKFGLGGVFYFVCYDANGKLKWETEAHNLVTDAGLEHILDVSLAGTTNASQLTWYLALTDDGPTIASADTMGSHAGWAEATAYDQATRPAWDEARTDLSVSNVLNLGTFTMNDADTVGGAFLTDLNTIGTTDGVLLCVAAASETDRVVASGDTLNVRYDIVATAT